MSPVSRGRNGRSKKPSPRRRTAPALSACDCPACSGEVGDHDTDVAELADGLIDGNAGLIDEQDPIGPELSGAMVVGFEELAGEDMLVGELVPAIEGRASPAALNLLSAVSCVATGRLGSAAAGAADRLVRLGVQPPVWAAEARETVTASDCCALGDDQDEYSLLLATFTRAGRSHTAVVIADHEDCGAAHDILLVDPEQVQALGEDLGIRSGKRRPMKPVDFRWAVEQAMAVRSEHDDEREAASYLDLDDEAPPYSIMAALLRARLLTLPVPTRAVVPHAEQPCVERGDWPKPEPKRPQAKRRRSGRRSPIYRIKVSLRDAKPPIWRRLEVPGDIRLDDLHDVIQVAFDWDGHHLHVFETPYGEFGEPDPELGHRPEATVTLKQVAPELKSKIRYSYDFGDGWEHDIVVEEIAPRDPGLEYPRCTGGRRAAPPDDCGGIWGYADLIRVVGDPTDPEHDHMVTWLGLAKAAEFDPDEFDADKVTEALADRLG